MGWNKNEGRVNKDFKKGGKLGQGVAALKKGRGAGTHLRTMNQLFLYQFCSHNAFLLNTLPAMFSKDINLYFQM